MKSKSTIVSVEQLMEFQKHINDLKKLRDEVKMAEAANLDLGYTSKDLEKQISDLELIIRTYSS